MNKKIIREKRVEVCMQWLLGGYNVLLVSLEDIEEIDGNVEDDVSSQFMCGDIPKGIFFEIHRENWIRRYSHNEDFHWDDGEFEDYVNVEEVYTKEPLEKRLKQEGDKKTVLVCPVSFITKGTDKITLGDDEYSHLYHHMIIVP